MLRKSLTGTNLVSLVRSPFEAERKATQSIPYKANEA